MTQLILHLFSDFVMQSDWMAAHKSKRSWPCFVHCLTYTLPFLFLTRSWAALAVIFGTHFLIDRFRLPRYVNWAKNHLAPWGYYEHWKGCSAFGYSTAKDPQVAFVLYLATDACLHLACNWCALKWL